MLTWVGALLLLLLLIVFVVTRVDALTIRDWLFTKNLGAAESRHRIFDPPSVQLSHSIDEDKVSARSIVDRVYGADKLETASALPTLDRVKFLIGLNHGLGGWGCGTIADIETKARVLFANMNFGCCSDFNEIFVLLAVATSTVVREVNTETHTFSEVWVPEFNEWVLVDSQFGLLVKLTNTRSGYASAYLTRERILKETPLEFFFVDKIDGQFRVPNLINRYYYDRVAWQTFRVVPASNVVSQSQFLADYQRATKLAIYFAAYLMGKLPKYEKYDEKYMKRNPN